MGPKSVSTIVCARSARNVLELEFAAMVVCAVDVRSAVDPKSTSTVVGAVPAKSAVGPKSASTVEDTATARNAVVQEYAATIVGAVDVRSAVDPKSASMVVGAADVKNAVPRAQTKTPRLWGLCASEYVLFRCPALRVVAPPVCVVNVHSQASSVILRSKYSYNNTVPRPVGRIRPEQLIISCPGSMHAFAAKTCLCPSETTSQPSSTAHDSLTARLQFSTNPRRKIMVPKW